MKTTSRQTFSLTAVMILFGSLAGGANAAIVSLGSFNGHDYFYDTGSHVSVTTATAAASSMGAELVSITTEAENDFLITAATPLVATSLRTAWIGLTRNSTAVPFEWISGESLNYTNWRPGGVGGVGFPEPTGETSGVMYINSPSGVPLGQWADTFPSGAEPFNAIYEKVPEPSSVLLLGVSSLGIILRRSRK